jgi:hypothetical protein
MHQMSRPLYKGYKTDSAAAKRPILIPVSANALRAIPHLKVMMRAIRKHDQESALKSGKLAYAEM